MCAHVKGFYWRYQITPRQRLSRLKTAPSQLQHTHSWQQKTTFSLLLTCSRQLIWNVCSKSSYSAVIALSKWGGYTIIIILYSCYHGYLCNINDILSKQAVQIRECWSIKTRQIDLFIFMYVITYYRVIFFHGSGSGIDLLKDAFFFYPCRDHMHSQLFI